ncbi:hypothetical protein AHAS_Ahas03G0322600 [Arachis hypogaea]
MGKEFICFLLIEKLGFEVPTLVQAQAIPVILAGRHALINAATGTGKTVAYLAPLIHHLQNYDTCIQRSDGTFGNVVLVSTCELCLQVYEIRFHWIVPGYVMGGENRSKEKARLRKGISVLIATPGRLLDHLKNTSSFLYTKLCWIIFDEADRKPVSTIESIDPLESDEEDEVKYSSKIPTAVDYKIPTQLIQRYVKVPCGSRLAVLPSILKHFFERDTSQKVVVFFSTCDAVDFHHSLLSEFHFSTDPQTKERVIQLFFGCQTFRLHGNMEHEDRRSTFQAFKTEKSALLLSTDVSARGLDFPKPKMDELAWKGFCSWVRAYTAHRGELKRIFMIKKLHLGHVAKSFALKQQPSLVGQSFQK